MGRARSGEKQPLSKGRRGRTIGMYAGCVSEGSESEKGKGTELGRLSCLAKRPSLL